MRLEELSDQIGNWMFTGKFEKHRCLYENEDILVRHFVAFYPNGTKDATMHVTLKKDGLMWRTETGVTPLPSKE